MTGKVTVTVPGQRASGSLAADPSLGLQPAQAQPPGKGLAGSWGQAAARGPQQPKPNCLAPDQSPKTAFLRPRRRCTECPGCARGGTGELPDKKAQRNPARCLVRPEQALWHGGHGPAMQFAAKPCPYIGSLRPGCWAWAHTGAGEQSCCLSCGTGRALGSRQAQPSFSSAWATLPSPGTCCQVSGRLDAAYTNQGMASAAPFEALLQKGTRSLGDLQAIQSKANVCQSTRIGFAPGAGRTAANRGSGQLGGNHPLW